MKKNVEFRNIDIKVESRRIEGFIPYNSESSDIGFYEVLDPHCFDKTLRESKDIRALFNHTDESILARTKNNSLHFENREDGLYFNFEAPNTTIGNDVLEMAKEDLLSGTSFGMIVMNDEWRTVEGRQCRKVKEARLIEVSVLTSLPAYPDSAVYCRSLSEALGNKESLDDTDIDSIKAEMEKLSALLPKKEEESVDGPDTQPEQKETATPNETTEPSEEEVKQLNDLMERLNEVQKILDKRSLNL